MVLLAVLAGVPLAVGVLAFLLTLRVFALLVPFAVLALLLPLAVLAFRIAARGGGSSLLGLVAADGKEHGGGGERSTYEQHDLLRRARDIHVARRATP
jgi:hypothetical protein